MLSLAAPRPSGRDLVLVASWLIIGLVAAYDTYLSVKFQDTLPLLEVNPLCRWLIAADEGSVAILRGCNFAGTILALGTTLLVYLSLQPIDGRGGRVGGGRLARPGADVPLHGVRGSVQLGFTAQ